MYDPFADFESDVLPNGLKIHAAHWPDRPWEAVGFVVHVGSSDDPIGLEGLSHFVEHLVTENSIMPIRKFVKLVEKNGGNFNRGSTGSFATKYDFFLPINKKLLFTTFNFFGEMLLLATLEKFVERERNVIEREFRRKYRFDFTLQNDMRCLKALYEGFWLERRPSHFGTLEAIRLISENDLQNHYDRFYVPANIEVIGIGGVSLAELKQVIKSSSLSAIKEGVENPALKQTNFFEPPSETKYSYCISDFIKIPMKSASYWSVARVPGTVKRKAISIAVRMINRMIFQKVREDSAWTYDIHCFWENMGGFWQVTINCKEMSPDAIGGIEKIMEEILDFAEKDENLFLECRESFVQRNKMLDCTAQGIRDVAMDDIATSREIISLKSEIQELKSVKMEQVSEIFKWLKSDMRWTCIVKP